MQQRQTTAMEAALTHYLQDVTTLPACPDLQAAPPQPDKNPGCSAVRTTLLVTIKMITDN